MGKTEPGRIVWVTIPDPQGRNPKRRPAVVLALTGDLTAGGVLAVAAVTTRIAVAPSGVVVSLPWHRDGHPRTRLRTASEVVCDWELTVPAETVEETGGIVPRNRFLEILALVQELRPGFLPPVPPT
ncbi:MAG: type II toxin-antitoxin system PemK/MazF family toxin [Fimbriiglobus sp.]